MAELKIEVYLCGKKEYECELDRAIELGRQESNAEKPFVPIDMTSAKLGNYRRVPVAKIGEDMISRKQFLIKPLLEPIGKLRFRVENPSTNQRIEVKWELPITVGKYRDLEPGAVLTKGDIEIHLIDARVPTPEQFQLQEPTIAPGNLTIQLPMQLPLLSDEEAAAVGNWLQTVSLVMQSAASSTDFYDRAAEGMVRLVGLDSGRVLLSDESGWRVAASRTGDSLATGQASWKPSETILKSVRSQRRTFWEFPSVAPDDLDNSLKDVEVVIAAPIIDQHGDVIGTLYGDKLRPPMVGQRNRRVTSLDAMLVETLACGVAAGLARMDKERQAIAAKIQFEQFFSAELAAKLAEHPDLLEGRDTEVTLLFCDIRGFSRIARELGATTTMDLISNVLGVLSDCVHTHQGVLVDYIGDELLAMWGAPTEQADHVQRACRAALDMLRELPALSETWQSRLGEPVKVGIGINTGVARIGNTGSHRKFKYGPLGDPVNLASRIQGATKYLQCTTLLSKATQSRLNDEFSTRRITSVRVVNIDTPVELYELSLATDPKWTELKEGYERALEYFERGNFLDACRVLGQLLPLFPEDGPVMALMSRAAAALVEKPVDFDPAWKLPGK